MAHSHNHDLGADLKPLSEISNYTIEKGDPDPRGYDVFTRDGRRIGEVDDLIVDTAAMKVRYLVVELDDEATAGGEPNRSILLSPEELELQRDGNRVIAHGYTGTEAAYTRAAAADRTVDDTRRTLTRTEEELHVGKREVNRGEARVSKHVETEHVSQPVTRRREEVVIERRPVEAGARGSASISDEEIRVPLMEEELVVEKRPVVKEELVIGKRVVEERDTVETELRREEFDIDNPTAKARTRGRNDR